MKTRKLAVLAAVFTLCASASAFAGDFDAPDSSGGNSTAHVPYNAGNQSTPAPTPEVEPAPAPRSETQTVMLNTFPIHVPVRVSVPQSGNR